MKKEQATEVWRKACQHLAEILTRDVYDRWIAQITAVALTQEQLELEVANDFYQSWLEENYLPLIQNAAATAAGRMLKIIFNVDRSVAAEASPQLPPAPANGRRSPRGRPVSGAPMNPKYTFESFVVGPSNDFAHAAALAVADAPAKAYNPLFIYGGVGLGKTHLMQGIGHALLARDPMKRIAYLSCEAFTNEYIDALQRKGLIAFRRKYRQTDILLIDDIHFLAGKERMQEEFFHTFNALHESRRQIVMTSDRPASEIHGLEHRLVSRFEWGLVTELVAPDFETRMAILLSKREELKLRAPDEALRFIAERIRSNIRSLEGALTRVASYLALTARPLTQTTLEYLLRDVLDQERTPAVSIEQVQRIVAEYFDIRFGDMTSKRRPQGIAFPRQVAMYLARQSTHHSLPAIGNAFSRNHATVLHACRKVSALAEKDTTLRQTLLTLVDKIGNGQTCA